MSSEKTRILDLLPASLKERLKQEVKEELQAEQSLKTTEIDADFIKFGAKLIAKNSNSKLS